MNGAWQKEVRLTKKVEQFEGGTKSEREHLNELVDAVNDITEAARNKPLPADGAESERLFYVNENGAAVLYLFQARRAVAT